MHPSSLLLHCVLPLCAPQPAHQGMSSTMEGIRSEAQEKGVFIMAALQGGMAAQRASH